MKIKHFLFMVLFIPLVLGACTGNSTNYEDVIGYWKANTKKSFLDSSPVYVVFQQDVVYIGTGRSKGVEFEIAEDPEDLTLLLETGASILIKDLEGNSLKISLPEDEHLDGKRDFFTYSLVDKSEYDAAKKKAEERFKPKVEELPLF